MVIPARRRANAGRLLPPPLRGLEITSPNPFHRKVQRQKAEQIHIEMRAARLLLLTVVVAREEIRSWRTRSARFKFAKLEKGYTVETSVKQIIRGRSWLS